MSLFRTIQDKTLIERTGTIRLRAIMMLAIFAANFFVVCHCSARIVEHSCCCSKKDDKAPCKDGRECNGMHAVKFNLLEKQVAKQVDTPPASPFITLAFRWPVLTTRVTRGFPDMDPHKYPPPDYQSLYQCFLI